MTGVTVLGSTGSIGVSTLDVLARHPDRFRVVALTANRDVEAMLAQCLRFRPNLVAMADPQAALTLRERLADVQGAPEVLVGVEGLTQAATLPEAGVVMAAIVGAAGLVPTLAAAHAGKRLLLANKEALVVAGALLMEAVADRGAVLLPIDSEHNAIFQCLPLGFADGLARVGVERILLTASGGPFLNTPREALPAVTPEQACAHPNWDMGRKISVDSATMMNKGLELIEACWLFGTGPERVQVVVHPQSVIHSLVQYVDGSVLAQLGNPDMRTPIAHALGWPERLVSGVPPLDLFAVGRLDFEPPDLERFPCLGLATAAAASGGTAPAVLNAANEVAVAAFLGGRIGFMAIADVVEETLAALPVESVAGRDIAFLLHVDGHARTVAEQAVNRRVT
ncbi:MAG TPA: 1-deoxy-D-xylulose-5-phosphate reductoisomerase [Chromatiaceae bacterium]|nr:1-deoxy-D-xylulose-5-phosphate reductoisomerase [Chromatiaceae bacterium]